LSGIPKIIHQSAEALIASGLPVLLFCKEKEPEVEIVFISQNSPRTTKVYVGVQKDYKMASPRTRRALKELKPKDGNNVRIQISVTDMFIEYVAILHVKNSIKMMDILFL